MKKALKIGLSILGLAMLLAAAATPQEQYIEKYADMAVAEMYRSGVPASITLAQGMLESRYGLSELAAKGNNHFGIKCHRDWTGESMRYDDDKAQECFRVYPSAADSYKDHSDFLRYKDRYKFLFDYATTDYKAWCYGLKKAGYATDPGYANKLIKVIEDYDLTRFDTMDKGSARKAMENASRKSAKEALLAAQKVAEEEAAAKAASSKDSSSKKNSRKHKASKKQAPAPVQEPEDAPQEPVSELYEALAEAEELEIPQSPLSLEEPQKWAEPQGEFTFSLTRPMYSRNGVPFVYALEGESFDEIARQYDLFKKEILRFNDLKASKALLPGDVVFVQAKKNKTARGLDMHIVDSSDETLWEISQRYGVKMESIAKLNGIAPDAVLAEGDRIRLR